ncbi:retron Ec78 anti-phage system effector ATPase PtuA [Aeromonas salmonicida]
MVNKPGWLRALENSAHRGDISSMFQLYLNYFDGTSEIEKDLRNADDYFNQCFLFLESTKDIENYIPENRFVLSEINLVNFRRFDSIKVRLESNVTVFIGGNGVGKTTIIDAISKVLSWIVSGIEKEGKNGSPIKYQEINNNEQCYFSDVNALFEFGIKTKVNGTISRSKLGTAEKRDSNVVELKSIANVWRVINSIKPINLPIFLCYSIARSHPAKRSNRPIVKEPSLLRTSRFDAYSGALDGAGKIDDFIEWFIELHKKTSNNGLFDIDLLETQVRKLKVLSSMDADFIEMYEQKVIDLSLAKNNVRDDEFEDNLKQMRTVIDAVVKVVPSIEDIWVETSSGSDEVKVKNDGGIVNFSQLSDGQRVLLSLIADLARRLVMLNPNISNPLEGQGVVLIDEIELHLHPAWQQGIVLALKDTFPNIQFVLTTHSPQILSTVDKKCIRQFYIDEHGTLQTKAPDFQTKGVTSADILARIMNTNSIPDIPEARLVEEFSRSLLNKNMHDALLVYKDIVSHFGEEHPVTYDCDNQIKIYQMKEMIQKRKNSKAGE